MDHQWGEGAVAHLAPPLATPLFRQTEVMHKRQNVTQFE